MMEAILSNIQRFSMHDGPGLRTTVFFKGCPLRCLWCHNPETYRFGQEVRYDKESCMFCGSCLKACPAGALSANGDEMAYDPQKCRRCFQCVNACPTGAMAVAGMRMTVEQILTEALRDKSIYQRSGGGVTLSGGECTSQPEAVEAILDGLHAEGVHAALDTCGQCAPDVFRRLAAKADIILFDLKHADPQKHKELTGRDNTLILSNLHLLEEMGAKVEIRIPFVPTLNDDEENLRATAEIIRPLKCITRTVLLGYHPLGQTKIYDFDHHGRDLGIERPKSADVKTAAEKMQEWTGKPAVSR